MSSTLVFQGTIIHSLDPENLENLESATLIVHDAHITGLYKCTDEIPQNAISPATKLHKLPFGDFLIPGFVDVHNHAEATRILANICHEKGQRALVGKCNMDRNAPDYICEENASASLCETEDCINHIRALGGNEDALVTPVVTPRFAICCTPELLQGQGNMIRGDDTLAMQTHFNEPQQEVDATKALFGARRTYTKVTGCSRPWPREILKTHREGCLRSLL
ncbi:hypothetical protein BHE90_016051 [Fusarium euwallaceae]|uniref:Uncharacterized protein n=1 Tax=Fusarium euwallaceae TaxID=1147111 RepID=A0A430L1K1_9HYPO|nr:hypothetical protein BHE90_016051 [Fusarium euwallaceae]